jgi:HlyD family secretion protein
MTKRRTRLLALSAVAAIALVAVAIGFLREGPARNEFQGWVEAYFIFVSPDESGRIETLSVREGDAVTIGTPLFALDADLQRAAVAENEAAVVNARITFERAQELLKRNVGSHKVFDDAEAALRSAEARLNSARTRLDRRRVLSPVTGTVQEVYFRVGEMVATGRPIVSLLPPDNTRVRFFVPEAVMPKLHIGDRVAVICDGCPGTLHARINFLSAQAEFTPPVIYSQEERERLVFRVEATPEDATAFRVGQPVTVRLFLAPGVSHAAR